MRVFTYYEPVPGRPRPTKLLDLWQESWESKGWECHILSEADAKSHPGYEAYSYRISRYPTVNPPGYERACYMRHLAMAMQGEISLLVDYDVLINPKGRPVGLPHDVRVSILEPTRVPCSVLASPDGFGDICDIIHSYDPKGEKHVSDMTILRKSNLPYDSVCVEHLDSGRPIVDDPGDGWKTAPMIHFSSFSFGKLGWTGDKADLIKRVLATL